MSLAHTHTHPHTPIFKPISSAAREQLCIALQARDSPKTEIAIKKRGLLQVLGSPPVGQSYYSDFSTASGSNLE